MAVPVEPAVEALAALVSQPVHPAQPAEAAALANAPTAAEVPVEVLNPPQAACNNDEVLLILVGGAVASWFVCSTPDRVVRVRDLAGDIVLCSWARHFTLTVLLSTQVYKWVPA